MASINEMKAAIQGVPGLSTKILNESVLRLVEEIYSEDPQPDSRKYGSFVTSFFSKRYNAANTITNQVQYVDGVADPSSLSNPKFDVVVQGFASNIVDTLAQDPANVAAWDALNGAAVDTAASAIVDGIVADKATFDGTVELIFNGAIAKVQEGEMRFADEVGLWDHPFGRFDA